MRFERLRSLHELQRHEPAWQRLHAGLQHAGLFASPAWVLNWLRAFARDSDVFTVMAYQGTELRAVFPLVRTRTRWRRVPVTALQACTNAHSVRSALLCDAASRGAAYQGLSELLHQQGGWDMLLLDGCDGPQQAQRVPALPQELPVDTWAHSSLHVQGRWGDYLAGRSRDLRRTLKRAQTALDAQGTARIELLQGPGIDAQRLFEQWAAVDRASWKARQGQTVDSTAQCRAYYQGMLHSLAQSGQLRAVVLWLQDQPAAVLVAAQDKRRLYTLKTAMREDLAAQRASPGAWVMAQLLESAWTSGNVDSVDFVARQAYTERWTSELQHFERRVSMAPTWRARLVGWLDQACQRTPSPQPQALAAKL